jgi:hypothetical protein
MSNHTNTPAFPATDAEVIAALPAAIASGDWTVFNPAAPTDDDLVAAIDRGVALGIYTVVDDDFLARLAAEI